MASAINLTLVQAIEIKRGEMTLPNLYILEEMALGIKAISSYYPDIIFVFDLFSFKIKGIELCENAQR